MDRSEHLRIWSEFFFDHGFPTFPLFGVTNGMCRCQEAESCSNPGKHPKIKGWRGITKPAPVSPLDNLGLSTDHLVVVDFDNGDPSNEFPETFRVRTRRGVHLYYLADTQRPIKLQVGWRPKIDIRAKGGLVAAPPSRTTDGAEYTYEGGIFQPVPDFIANTVRPYVQRDRQAPVEDIPNGTADQVKPLMEKLVEQVATAPSGERNQTLFNALCRFFELARTGWAGEDSLSDICQAALQSGLGLEEVKRTVESASRSLTY